MQTVQRNQANGHSDKFQFAVIKAATDKLVQDTENKRYAAGPESSNTGSETTDEDVINSGNASPPKAVADKSNLVPQAAGNQDGSPILPK